MCKTRSEGQYARALQQTTLDFSSLSTTVRGIESQLQENGSSQLAAGVRQIQEHERDKLRASMSLQALRKAEAFETFSWQQDGAPIAGARADVAGTPLAYADRFLVSAVVNELCWFCCLAAPSAWQSHGISGLTTRADNCAFRTSINVASRFVQCSLNGALLPYV